MVGGAAGGFASGFSGSLLNGGSIGDAFKAGIIGAAVGAATAWAAHGIGGFFDTVGGEWVEGTFGNWAGRTIAHATVGGAASVAQGGQFRHGFYSSAASTGFMHSRLGSRLMRNSHIAVRTATAAAIGGTASVLGGGKFANGAVVRFSIFSTKKRTAKMIHVIIVDDLDETAGTQMAETAVSDQNG